VEFRGIMKHEEVAETMRRSTAFVQHSLEPRFGSGKGDREGTPVAILEAMMSGLPVISTKHAGIPEVVENETMGLLCNERDVNGMAKAMTRLGTNREEATVFGQLARTRAMKMFSSERYLEQLMRVINAVSKSSEQKT
jgi:glycosyltransferase involved in cell wall biosynthesis